MRSFGVVDEKLAEADFFLDEIAAERFNMFRVRFLFSAFAAAARSVTFALQGSLRGADGFDDWYSARQDELRTNKLARFFHDCRTDSQHLGLNPVMGGYSGKDEHGFHFGQPEQNRYAELPSMDVVTACREYMRIICSVIDMAYTDF